MSGGAVSPTPEEAEATVREAIYRWRVEWTGFARADALEALDVLVAALRDARREVAALEWRRDWQYDKAVGWRDRAVKAERERDQAREEIEDAISEIGEYSEGLAPPNLLGAVQWLVHEETSTRRERDQARDALAELDRWVSRMPDAGFTSESPRWQWWHERPIAVARAALGGAAEDGAA